MNSKNAAGTTESKDAPDRQKNERKRPFYRWIVLLLRIALAGIFIYAGSTKIGDPQAFADSIATFQLIPPYFINLLALGLPPFEIIIGLMLLTAWKLRSASFCVLFLAVIFAVALVQALVRGLEVDCGCFGSGEPSVWKTWASLGRDFLLLAAAAWVYRASWDGHSRIRHILPGNKNHSPNP